MRRITTTCWASFWPKNATSGATMLNSLQTTVQTPSKWPGPRSAPSRTSPEPGDADRRGEAVGVDLGDGGGEQHVDAELGDRGVARLRARVGVEVAGLVELRRVDEQRDDDLVAALARGAHQRLVAGVERAHRRHEPDARPAARAAATCARTSAIVRSVFMPRPGDRPRRVGQRVEQRQEVGRALRDRGALARDRGLVAARDRAR